MGECETTLRAASRSCSLSGRTAADVSTRLFHIARAFIAHACRRSYTAGWPVVGLRRALKTINHHDRYTTFCL